MGDQDKGLNFDSATLDNVATGVTRPFVVANDLVIPAAAILLFLLCIFLTVRCTKSSKQSFSQSWLISHWPAALKAALFPLLISYALTHAFSAGSVFYNTKVANPSTESYFQAMGVGRLLSLSHAHLFAHATMYFLLAALVQFTGRGRLVTVYAPLMALWAGVFDVVSWWGFKKVSPSFEVLSAMCGSLFSLGFLVMAFAILKSAVTPPKDFK